MSISISSILESHQPLLKERQQEVQFDIDLQGKRILDKITSRFYRKRPLSNAAVIDIIITSVVTIEKMSKLKRCSWTIAELCELLYNGVDYYENYFKIDINELLSDGSENAREFRKDLSDKISVTPQFKTMDGHYVHSEAEQAIDNFLFRSGIIHAYEKRLPGDSCFYCDFYIPPQDTNQPVYIEYWDEPHSETMNRKLEIYNRERLQLIEITKTNLKNLKAYLGEKLRLFQVRVE